MYNGKQIADMAAVNPGGETVRVVQNQGDVQKDIRIARHGKITGLQLPPHSIVTMIDTQAD